MQGQSPTPCPVLIFNDPTGSSAEAAFMTGLERNSDIVFAASYAPLLNVNEKTSIFTFCTDNYSVTARILQARNGYAPKSIFTQAA